MEWYPILEGLPDVYGDVWRLRDKGVPNSGFTAVLPMEQRNILGRWPGWLSEKTRRALEKALRRFLRELAQQNRQPEIRERFGVLASDF